MPMHCKQETSRRRQGLEKEMWHLKHLTPQHRLVFLVIILAAAIFALAMSCQSNVAIYIKRDNA
jgi:hypothetical protein